MTDRSVTPVSEHPEATPGRDYMIVWVCPICGNQANTLRLGLAECYGKGSSRVRHPGPVTCQAVKMMPYNGTLASERDA
jgi:hypothetical protein